MSGRRLLATILSTFVVLFATTNVHAACNSDGPSYDKSLKISDDATQKFMDGKFAEAGAGYQDAYAACAEPTYLKNQMIAFFKAEMCPEALRAADDYKTISPNQDIPVEDRPDWQKVNMRCRVMMARVAIDTKDFTSAESLLNESYRYGPVDEDLAQIKSMEDEVRAAKSGKAPEENIQDPEAAEPDERSNILPIVGWSAFGVGASILSVAAVMYLTGPNADLNSLEAECNTDPNCEWQDLPNSGGDYLKLHDEIRNDAQGFIPWWITGGVIAGAGVGVLVYHYFIADDPQEQTVTVIPILGPDTVGAGVHWNF